MVPPGLRKLINDPRESAFSCSFPATGLQWSCIAGSPALHRTFFARRPELQVRAPAPGAAAEPESSRFVPSRGVVREQARPTGLQACDESGLAGHLHSRSDPPSGGQRKVFEEFDGGRLRNWSVLFEPGDQILVAVLGERQAVALNGSGRQAGFQVAGLPNQGGGFEPGQGHVPHGAGVRPRRSRMAA